MKEFYGQWIEGAEMYFLYVNKEVRFRFNHWTDDPPYTREADKSLTESHYLKFKLTLVY